MSERGETISGCTMSLGIPKAWPMEGWYLHDHFFKAPCDDLSWIFVCRAVCNGTLPCHEFFGGWLPDCQSAQTWCGKLEQELWLCLMCWNWYLGREFWNFGHVPPTRQKIGGSKEGSTTLKPSRPGDPMSARIHEWWSWHGWHAVRGCLWQRAAPIRVAAPNAIGILCRWILIIPFIPHDYPISIL